MRIMIKFAFPTEAGNTAIRDGKFAKVFQSLMEELKPEAAYFFPEGGERAGFFVVDMKDPLRSRKSPNGSFSVLMPRSKWSR